MNYVQLSRIYSSLSEPERGFIREKTIESAYTVKQWMILLQKVAAYDEANDRIRKKLLTWLIVTAVIAFFGLFFFWILSLLGVGVFVAVLLMRRRLSSNDLSNHLRLFLIPLLKVFNDKAGLKAPLNLRCDFRPVDKQEILDKYKVENRTIRHFKPQWLSGSVPLKDESQLEFHLMDDLKKVVVKKRSASGKTKWKNKVKSTHFLLVKLSLSKEYYQLKSELSEDVIAEQDDKKITLKAKYKQKSSDANFVIPIDEFLKLLELLYSCVEQIPGKIPTKVQADEGDGEDEADFEALDHDELDAPDATAFAASSFLVWSAYDFSDHDFDSFDYESAPVFADELESDSLFDS